jgi:CelD/BcsL family acetyltransferase involved in cellulose biosynthesis
MRVEITHSIEQIDALRIPWERVYASDPNATIHRSWAWIRSWIEATPFEWCILATKDNGEYTSFIPLAMRKTKKQHTELLMGGHPMSAHTGFICMPDVASYAIPALAKYICRNFKWSRFYISDSLDPRVNIFIDSLSSLRYKINILEKTPCPYIQLPTTWDEYLRDCLGKRTRYDAGNLLRQLERLKSFRLLYANNQNIDELTRITLQLWQQRWGSKAHDELKQYIDLLKYTMQYDILRLSVYMDGDIPFATLASWLDKDKYEYNGFIFCFNPEYKGIKSPGKAAIFHEIRTAISEKYRLFNFGRGNEEYKNHFGVVERMDENILITKKSIRQQIKSLVGMN